ncbi:MAG: hypothetical protein V1932_04705 [Chloroflexota bacterium]
MNKSHSMWRIGLYECHVSGDIVSRGKSLKKYYYGLFHRDLIDSMILPDLRDMKRTGHSFNFPVLVMTWRLGRGDPPKPLTRPSGTLTVERAGGLRKLRRMVGIPTQRKGIQQTKNYEAIIDDQGHVYEVDRQRQT